MAGAAVIAAGHQCAGGARISVRVRRRRRELCGFTRRSRGARARRWRRPRAGSRTTSTSRCGWRWCRWRRSARSGLDVRVARFGPSANLSYAMFSGGGLGWAEAAMKRGEFAVAAAPPGTQPDLTGLSCRFEEIPSARGLILSVLVVPAQAPIRFAFAR